ncbi:MULTISPECIES: cyanoexosortase A system-associated protein [unclassified Leptolyngbya]|uniref:cyanoexosortase A system-associated protein n=1 Tax=unclassified Leptolyngbya TaxID=2650499 RepID=UPI0016863F2E|nr:MULTISPECIES: cyanoexosortase A system-associated protein [unclassified Leptolyngbya]MBD1911488.1 cyanoexosortase A system-associated protein [Leptolyngbya sp. FACHB-8]MBD2155273.1 cyanoexosortase A system-associated protein [Leptolyngbya sp. FACHB-16]
MTSLTPSLRASWLALLCGGVLITLAKVLWLMPTRMIAAPTVFADAIELPNWRSQPPQSLPIPENKANELRAVALYRYHQGDRQLDIEMRYLEKSDTSVRNLILQYGKVTPTIPFESTIRQNEAGYYSLFAEGDTAYLSSCINPKGGTTVTSAQFTQNRYTYDLRLDRAIPIVLGQVSLQDSRCLWTYMTLAIAPNASAEATYPVLEASWERWQTQWQSRFPNP